MPPTFRIAELEKALAGLVAAAGPIKDKDWPSANEWDDFDAAVERARKVL